MFKKMLVLGLLLPALGGCLVHADRGGHHEGHRSHRRAVVATPVHSHGHGCGHVLRGGVWIVVN